MSMYLTDKFMTIVVVNHACPFFLGLSFGHIVLVKISKMGHQRQLVLES